jgi:hypothetical protein
MDVCLRHNQLSVYGSSSFYDFGSTVRPKHISMQCIVETIMFSSMLIRGDPLNDAQIYSLVFNNAWKIAD